jgi:hypothetical protein
VAVARDGFAGDDEHHVMTRKKIIVAKTRREKYD